MLEPSSSVLVAEYQAALPLTKSRLDGHMVKRGTWQRAMFAVYYRRFGLLPLPPPLEGLTASVGVNIRMEKAAADYNPAAAYDLTHDVFVAFDC